MACKHSDMFGRPAEGAHRHRIGGLAAVDLIATAGAAVLFTRLALGQKDIETGLLVFLVFIILGILAHEAFCVDTRFNAFIFGRPWGPGAVNSQRQPPQTLV